MNQPLQATCDFLIESQLPSIIDGLVGVIVIVIVISIIIKALSINIIIMSIVQVNDNLDPTTICTQTLGACP